MKKITGIILAGGKSARYKTGKHKFLARYSGKPIIVRVVEAMKPVVEKIIIVTPPQNNEIKQVLKNFTEIEYTVQEKPLGTGHALLVTDYLLENIQSTILVSYADKPLITTSTLKKLLDRHIENSADITIATTILPDPGTKGRIVRNNGKFAGVIEVKDADDEILKIKEVNAGFLVCESNSIYKELRKIKNNNAAGEYYLTDVYAEYIKDGFIVQTVEIPPEESCDINTIEEITRIEEWLKSVRRISKEK